MTPIWRHLTNAAGMTAQTLADATGLSLQAVRHDLVELETQGKVSRQRGAVGKPHIWWRTEKRPLDGLDVLVIMALAAEIHSSPAKLKEVLADIGSRAKHSGIRRIVAMCAMSKVPHQIVRTAIQEYDAETFDEALRAA
ncbi:DeoR family transcriptional regulator [Pseudomonas asturiensis]|uniref:DeoR family transcriptional regulator n=1 Tax=Pseudomonas asturiensis TaxID=1190415 RepID=A0ABX6HD41_9PSED|nr:FaeA/PapI family transcriptional regulator [Pseudomonas asturiensis]QHF03288.1 DeoR family transcriptional regulator [Pseudomonas asturiensis]